VAKKLLKVTNNAPNITSSLIMNSVAVIPTEKRKRDDNEFSLDPSFAAAKKIRGEHRTKLSQGSCEHIRLEGSSDLPDPAVITSPDDYLVRLVKALCGVSVKSKSGLELVDFFPTVTEQQMASYTTEITTAARQNDIETLKKLCSTDDKSSSCYSSLNCANRFGETLLHIACRRGYKDLVRHLLDQPKISVRVIDDGGRTPLHDTCWNPNPQLEVAQWIIVQDPSLFLIADKRGFTPFQYARPEHWRQWRQFLFENQESLKKLADASNLSKFT
jgi:ankyrin repeat protein